MTRLLAASNPWPPAGTVIGYTCVGVDKYNKIADGNGGFTTVLAETNSSVCGYVPPAAGTVLGEYCQGVDLWRRYADGSGGSYTQLYQANSTTCGYVPPPAAGTVLGEYCQGVDLWRRYADGSGGSYTQLYQANSPSCGYVPPAAGTVLEQYCQGLDLWRRYADGSGGSYTQLYQANSPTCGYVPPAAGTVLEEYCQGYDLWRRYADGSGGSYTQLYQANSSSCGYVPPPVEYTTTYTSNTTWVCPAGVTLVSKVVGAGARGTDGTAAYYDPPIDRSTYITMVNRQDINSTGVNAGTLRWEDCQSTMYDAVNALSPGGNVTVTRRHYLQYLNGYKIETSNFVISNVVPSTSRAYVSAGWQTSGFVVVESMEFAYIAWKEYGTYHPEVPPTQGTAAAAFGHIYPGSLGNVPVTPTTNTNIAVNPGQSYAFSIPAGGFITVTYYK